MTITLDTTVSGETANSYADVAYATAYFEVLPHFTSVWVGLSSDQKNAALIRAGRAIDRYEFLGNKYDLDQSMAFPRSIHFDPKYKLLRVNEIPVEVKQAQCEMVIYQHFNADSTTGQGSRDISSVSVSGVVSVQFEDKPVKQDSAFGGNLETVEALLSAWVQSKNTFRINK